MRLIIILIVVIALIVIGECRSVEPDIEEYLIKRMKNLSYDLDQIHSKYGDITSPFSFTNTSTGKIKESMINAMINEIKIRLFIDPSLKLINLSEKVYDTANLTFRGIHNISQARVLFSIFPCIIFKYDYGGIPIEYKCTAVYGVSSFLYLFQVSRIGSDVFEVSAYNAATLLKPNPDLAYQFLHGYPVYGYQLYPYLSYNFIACRYTRVHKDGLVKFYLSEFYIQPLDYTSEVSTNKNFEVQFVEIPDITYKFYIIITIFFCAAFIYMASKSNS